MLEVLQQEAVWQEDSESLTPSLASGSTAASDRLSSPALSSDSTCFSPSVMSLSSVEPSITRDEKTTSLLSNIKSFLTGEPPRRHRRKSRDARDSHEKILKTQLDILTSQSKLKNQRAIVDALAQDMSASMLDSNSATMLPSLISALPSGKEKGMFLSVDVGGSTLRIALIELFGRASGISPRVVGSDTHPINAATKSLKGKDFFRWIGCHIKSLLELLGVNDKHTSMGLSWSFPFAQLESVSRGTILTMGKGYHVADEIAGWDLRTAFEDSFAELSLDISLTAVVNDTVASLLSHAYMNPSTRVAVILGTGVNSSALVTDANGNDKLINTEMSLMGGDGVLPQTGWDRYLDARVERPGFQPFETMVSGRYMGEVSRLIICDLQAVGWITLHPAATASTMLSTPYAFETPLMAKIEGLYYSGKTVKAKHIFEEATKVTLSEFDFGKVAGVLRAVSNRSANWIAASILALVRNLGDDATHDGLETRAVTIAYSGTVIEEYPALKERCQRTLQELGVSTDGGIQYKLTLEGMLDGTLFGPAIASAMYA